MLHSLESASFNRTLQVIFAIALGLLIVESAQLLRTWLALKRLLLALNRSPLRRTFRALQGLSMRSLWSASGTSSRSRSMIFSHQLPYKGRKALREFDTSPPDVADGTQLVISRGIAGGRTRVPDTVYRPLQFPSAISRGVRHKSKVTRLDARCDVFLIPSSTSQ